MNKDRPHPTIFIPIKYGEIDSEIAPIIEWLNSFSFIYTMHCCQGDEIDDEEYCPEPYISFISYDYQCIDRWGNPINKGKTKKLLNKLLKYGKMDKNCNESDSKDGRISYFCFRFHNKDKMREFIKKELQ